MAQSLETGFEALGKIHLLVVVNKQCYNKLLESFHFLMDLSLFFFFFPEAKVTKKQSVPNQQVEILIITLNIIYYRNP